MATPVWRSLQSQLFRFCKLKPATNSPVSLRPTIQGCLSKRMASGRTMHVSPSDFNWTRFKNEAHFYTLLGIVPLGSIILYSNLIIGQSELADIPEGYEPKKWEYYKHPISRWFAKYIFDDPIKQYEMEACKAAHTFEAARNNARIARVKDMIHRDDDYRAFYFVPAVDPRASDKVGTEFKDFKLNQQGSH